MKLLAALAFLLTLGSAARALPDPVTAQDFPPPSIAANAMFIGPAAAVMEYDYFRSASSPQAAGRIFPCRLRQMVFEKTRIALACN
jgi:hypothetical protein